jgi:hypothetical protein
MKCGTTSLYYLLADHPEVAMSARKETDFFIAEGNFHRGLAWYQSQFRGEAKAVGEVSPNYTKCHLFAGVPDRINDVVPDAKLIYLVRDPIRRTVSHYVSSRSVGREHRSLENALNDVTTSNYVLTSMYHRQIEPYLDRFARDNMLFLPTEDLARRPRAVMRRVYRFVGVDDQFESEWIEATLNDSAAKTVQPRWFRWISDTLLSQPLKDRIRPYFPEEWIPGKRLRRPELTPDLRRKMIDHLGPDVEKFRTVTGRSFESWSM